MSFGTKRSTVPHLKKRAEFLRVSGVGKRAPTPSLILQAAPQDGPRDGLRDGTAEADRRVGYTASRKVGNAVKRNRAKRRLRAAVREILSAHGAHDHDYVLVARSATVERRWDDLRADLRGALKRLKLYIDA
jgi:ribonuclease P protein component